MIGPGSTAQEHRYDTQGDDASRYQALLSMWRASSEEDRRRFVVFLKTAHPNLFAMTINKGG